MKLVILSCAKPEIQPIPSVSNAMELVREKLTSLITPIVYLKRVVPVHDSNTQRA